MATDPLADAEEHIAKKHAPQRSDALSQEPLRTWVLGFINLKIRKGRLFSWDEIEVRLARAAAEAAKPGSKIFVKKEGGRSDRGRATTEEERKVCASINGGLGRRAIRGWLKRTDPDLYLELQRVGNSEGTEGAI